MEETQKKQSSLTEAGTVERRRYPRTQKYGPQRLTITRGPGAGGKAIEGTLWDFSEGGVGMDVPESLEIDEVVRIEGDLHSPDLSMSMTAQARVAYCRRVDGSRYRIGFGFLDVKYRHVETKPN